MIIDVLIIYFENEIKPWEIPLFRGAIINSLSRKRLLLHNHDGENYRYGYPMIQYKVIDGRATIVCLGQGVEDIQELFLLDELNLYLGKRHVECKIAGVSPIRLDVGVSDQMHTYRLERWCCLNEGNFKTFSSSTGIVERAIMLERILVGNILSFAKGIGMTVDEQITATITNLSDVYYLRAKGVAMACVDIEFRSNFVLPEYIGLGKHVSINFGLITKKE